MHPTGRQCQESGPPHELQIQMVACPRNQKSLQGEVVGFRRPLRLYGGPSIAARFPLKLDRDALTSRCIRPVEMSRIGWPRRLVVLTRRRIKKSSWSDPG